MDDLTPEQKPFAKNRATFPNADKLTDLLEVVKLLNQLFSRNLNTAEYFTKEAVVPRCGVKNTNVHVYSSLSNPTKLAEASAEDLIVWSDGKAFVAQQVFF